MKKKIPATEEIEIAIASYFGISRHIIVPNISWGLNLHECDILIIRESGYAVEVEIKRSKQDLLNDFKKQHGHRSKKIKELWYAIPEEYAENWQEIIPLDCGIFTYRRLDGGWVYISFFRRGENRECRKLTEKEMLKVAKLGCMRIWNLKQRLHDTIYQDKFLRCV